MEIYKGEIMEEINLKTETTNKNKSNKKIWIIILVSVAAFFVSFFAIDALLSSGNKPELEITGTKMSVDYNEYLGYSAVIKGTVKNSSNKNYSYASVEFSVYDAAGNNLGTAIANINNLSKGDTWNFEAHLLSYPSSRPVSFKLVEITVW